MKTKSFVQEIEFKATPGELYNMLMDENIHAEFTGASAKISKRKGGKFNVWDDYITGKNIELKKDEKIVQEWHASDMPAGHISIVIFEFIPKTKSVTILRLTHKNVPAALCDSYEKGWPASYWKPMKAWLSKK